MSQAQADADFGLAAAIANATAGKATAAASSICTAAVSKAAGDLTRALNAVQTGFVDAATAASLKATKTIAAAETVERKAVAKADVVLAQDLQSAWGTYAAAERSAVTLNARERATIGADYKKDVAGAELAAVKAVAPARETSMVAAAEANGVYHVKVTGIVADLGILSGELRVESTKAKATSLSDWLGKKAQALWTTANDVVGTISKSYDAISMAAHTFLSGLGAFPGYGVFPDAADLALTIVEIPFGKSDGKDAALATVSLATTVAPGPVDVAAGGVKITTRMAKAGAKVADGAGAAGRGFDEIASAGRSFVSPKGGEYGKVRAGNQGGPVHHTPAAKVSPFEYRKAPSVWMETADHQKTASWGRSKAAQAYRDKQDALINSGKLRAAIQMDIDDIRSKFGNKYEANIKQRLESFGFSK
jgi:hypothetical protein